MEIESKMFESILKIVSSLSDVLYCNVFRGKAVKISGREQ